MNFKYIHTGTFKKYFIIVVTRIVFVLISQKLSSQEQCLIRNYFFNNFYNLNPAAAGYDGAFFSQISYFKKWSGISNSPSGEVFSNSLRLGEEEFYDENMFLNRPIIDISKRVGVGLTFFSETNGPLNHTGALFAYAYHMHTHNGRIAMGLSAKIARYKLNAKEFKPVEESDPVLYTNTSAIIPDANAGFLFYNRRFFTGISMNGIFNFNHSLNHNYSFPNIVVCAGYKLRMKQTVKVEPSLFFFSYGKDDISVDLNTKIYFLDIFWLLISYQSNGEVQAGFDLKLTEGLHFNYSYSINTSGLATYFQGSHIVSLRADIAAQIKKR